MNSVNGTQYDHFVIFYDCKQYSDQENENSKFWNLVQDKITKLCYQNKELSNFEEKIKKRQQNETTKVGLKFVLFVISEKGDDIQTLQICKILMEYLKEKNLM